MPACRWVVRCRDGPSSSRGVTASDRPPPETQRAAWRPLEVARQVSRTGVEASRSRRGNDTCRPEPRRPGACCVTYTILRQQRNPDIEAPLFPRSLWLIQGHMRLATQAAAQALRVGFPTGAGLG